VTPAKVMTSFVWAKALGLAAISALALAVRAKTSARVVLDMRNLP
jgi:hypothetical protein